MKFTLRSAELLDQALCVFPCFKTLELLTVDEIEIGELEVMPSFNKLLHSVLRLPMIYHFGAGHWSFPFLLRFDSRKPIQFVISSSLRSLLLKRADMRNVLREIDWPPRVCNIEFVDCRFSPESLVSLLNGIGAGIHHPISLSLEGIAIGEKDRAKFNGMSSSIPELSQIVELNWTRNRIDGDWIYEFCRIFLTESLRFLDISECIKRADISTYVTIFEKLGGARLWGLAMRGSASGGGDFCYEDQLQTLFPGLLKLKVLTHLDISFHFFGVAVLPHFVDMVRIMTSLAELSIDGTMLAPASEFYRLYSGLVQTAQWIRSLQRPLSDLKRLEQEPAKCPDFTALRRAVMPLGLPSTRRVRCAYYERCPADCARMLEFVEKFPVSALPCAAPDEFVMYQIAPSARSVRSLHDRAMEPIRDSLADAQLEQLPSPYVDPPDRHRRDVFSIPDRAAATRGTYQGKHEHIKTAEFADPQHAVQRFASWVIPANSRLFRSTRIAHEVVTVYGNSLQDTLRTGVRVEMPPVFVAADGIRMLETRMDEVLKQPELAKGFASLKVSDGAGAAATLRSEVDFTRGRLGLATPKIPQVPGDAANAAPLRPSFAIAPRTIASVDLPPPLTSKAASGRPEPVSALATPLSPSVPVSQLDLMTPAPIPLNVGMPLNSSTTAAVGQSVSRFVAPPARIGMPGDVPPPFGTGIPAVPMVPSPGLGVPLSLSTGMPPGAAEASMPAVPILRNMPPGGAAESVPLVPAPLSTGIPPGLGSAPAAPSMEVSPALSTGMPPGLAPATVPPLAKALGSIPAAPFIDVPPGLSTGIPPGLAPRT
jgi:hypothetical protein